MVAGAKVAGPQPRAAVGYDGRIYRRCIHGIFLNDYVRLVNDDGSTNDIKRDRRPEPSTALRT